MVSSMDGQKRLILPNEEMQGSAITDPSSYTLCRGTGMIVWHKVAFGKIQNQSFQKSNEKQVTHCSRNFEKKIKRRALILGLSKTFFTFLVFGMNCRRST